MTMHRISRSHPASRGTSVASCWLAAEQKRPMDDSNGENEEHTELSHDDWTAHTHKEPAQGRGRGRSAHSSLASPFAAALTASATLAFSEAGAGVAELDALLRVTLMMFLPPNAIMRMVRISGQKPPITGAIGRTKEKRT